METDKKRKQNVLIVDDEKENLSGFKYLFEDTYNIYTAESAAEGKKILEQVSIQVVISDQRMPQMTGVEFLQQVLNEFPDTVRMILTGYSDFNAIIDAVNKGHIYYYFSKPWNEGEMKLIIDNALETIQLKKELEQSEECFRQLSENIKEILWLLSTDWKTLHYISPAYKAIFNFSQESLHENPLLWVDSVFSEDMELVTSFMHNAKKKLDDELILPEFRIVNRDNSIRWLSFKLFPVKGQDGKVSRFAGLMEDITNNKQLTEILVQSEKLVSIGGLAAGIAHELNNPLSAIMQSSQIIKKRLSFEQARNHKIAEENSLNLEALQGYLEKSNVFRTLDIINKASSRAASIISDMLAFSRKSDSSKAKVQIQTILDNIINISRCDFDLNEKTNFKDINIIKEIDENLPAIYCNEIEIGQVFLNLLRNAAQAIKSASKNSLGEIAVRARNERDELLLEIEDNGQGMELGTMNRIFEPFFTTKAKGEGTGLGLSISYKIITINHKGHISVSSEPGHGTTFSIRLPIASPG